MSNHKYISKYVVCPYYHRHDTNRVCCEGTNEENTINLVFGNGRQLKTYCVMYCNSLEGHRRCLLFRALNLKYGVKDNGV